MSVACDGFCIKALEKAKAQSLNCQNGYIGTEHLLWGLLEEKGSLYHVLEGLKVPLEELFKALDASMRDYEKLTAEEGPQTPRLRRIISDAEQKALALMEPRISERILVKSLFSGGRGTAVRILLDMPLNLTDILARMEKENREALKEQTLKLAPGHIPLTGSPLHYIPSRPLTAAAGRQNESLNTDIMTLFGRDLTMLAYTRKLDRAIGRDKELEEICLCLRRATAHNPVLVGEDGIGRTALIEGLACLCAAKDTPEPLKSLKMVEVTRENFTRILTSSKGGEERLREFLEKSSCGRVLVFLNAVMEAQEDDRIIWPALVSGMNLIKSYAGSGRIQIITAMTPAAYEKLIARDPLLGKSCQKIEIREPDIVHAIKIVNAAAPRFEKHHRLQIDGEKVSLLVELAAEYIKDRRLPGKAFDVLDEACAAAARHGDRKILEEEDIIYAVSRKSGLPAEKVSRRSEKFRHMEEDLQKRIIGQDEAIKMVCDRVKLFMTGFHQENRPLGVLFFAGPTGVGKTELARVTSSYLFGDDSHFYRFDMSEYGEHHEVSRLVGSPPGYVGHEEEGQLTGKVKRDPYCVILFDEIEKAHSRIFDIFLQVFDAGRLTDSKGITVDFRNTLIILTSNLADDKALREKFAPEFINRLDGIVLFRSLTAADTAQIAFLIIEEWKKKSRKLGVDFTISDSLRDNLCAEGYSSEYGVRNMKRIIENRLIIPLSKKVLEGEFRAGDCVQAGFADGEVRFSRIENDEDRREEER